MRKQDEIDWRKLSKGQRRFGQALRTDGKKWQANSDAGKQNRIGQDGDPEKIDQNSGVTEQRRGEIVVFPSVGGWAGEDRGDGPAAFDDPFPAEMGRRVAGLDGVGGWVAFRLRECNCND